MSQSCTFDEFKKSVSDFLHNSLTADLSTLEQAFSVVSTMHQNIAPAPQGTLKLVVGSTWDFVIREYDKCSIKATLKNICV